MISKPTTTLPIRAVYTIVVVLTFLFASAIVWFIMDSIFISIRAAATAVATDLGTDTPTYLQIDLFYVSVYKYLLVIGLIILSYWVYLYSQRKGMRI